MVFEISQLAIACAGAIIFMLPAYIANLSGLAFGGGEPIDDGRNFDKNMIIDTFSDNRRIVGNGVTWKGCFNGTVLGTFVGGILGYIGTYVGNLGVVTHGVITIPAYGSLVEGLALGFLLAFGALAGDAVGSFIKRRIGLQSGEPAPLLDQLDFVAGSLLLSLLVVPLTVNFVLIIVVISIILHLGSNSIAYLLGIKDVWY